MSVGLDTGCPYLIAMFLESPTCMVPSVLLLYRQHQGDSCINYKAEIRVELLSVFREQYAARMYWRELLKQTRQIS